MFASVLNKLFRTKTKDNVTTKGKAQSLTVELDSGVNIHVGNAQHRGARPYQEDSCGFSALTADAINEKGILAVLADGMGGLENGKAVSEKTVAEFVGWFNENSCCDGGVDLKLFAEQLNEAICREFCPDGRITSGTTLVCAMVKNGELHWLCIGDSRLYLKRGARMYQINEDHDYLNMLLSDVLSGAMTMEEALSEPQKDSLVGCIGKCDLTSFEYSRKGLKLEDGDKIVLCSDGVYNGISYEAFNNFLESEPQTAAEKIAREVIKSKNPCQDNLTVMVMGYSDPVKKEEKQKEI